MITQQIINKIKHSKILWFIGIYLASAISYGIIIWLMRQFVILLK